MHKALLALVLLESLICIKGLSIAENESVTNPVQLNHSKDIFRQLNEAALLNEDDNNQDDDIYDGRIIGGSAGRITQFPYQASLQQAGAHICGGSIITKNIIISAAHCILEPWNIPSYKVRVFSAHHSFGGQLFAVKHILNHENYSSATQDYDITLVKLAGDIRFPKYGKPIALASAVDRLLPKTRLYVSGWGFASEGGSITSELQYVAVKLFPQSTCIQNYQQLAIITDNMLCAGEQNGGKDSCQGDSGGPLVKFYKGEPKLYGIVSWGIGCAQRGYPGVYTNVSALRSWIDDRVNGM